jgi:hypothetical protein
MTCRPDHSARHADFEKGNAAAEKHGAHSERRWRPLAAQLAAEVLVDAPWLSRPAFRLTVLAWSVTEAKAQIVDEWLDANGLLDDEGNPRPANGLSDRLHGRAAHLRAAMGIDPTSFAKLLATFAAVPGAEDELAALKREGARLIAARSAALQPATTPNGASGTVNAAQTAAEGPEVSSEVST